jgi:hypothetical protein
MHGQGIFTTQRGSSKTGQWDKGTIVHWNSDDENQVDLQEEFKPTEAIDDSQNTPAQKLN